MATFNLAITYPDAQGPRIIAALKAHYAEVDENGQPVPMTNAQAIEKLRGSVTSSLRDIVFRTEREAVRAAADAGVTPPDVT